MNGELALKEFHEKTYTKEIIKINERIYHFSCYGHSNATAIIGETSVILVDALDNNTYSKELLKDLQIITDKPVKTIIYTHSHPDHRGGAGTFRDTVEEVIAFSPNKPALKYYDKINDVLMKRGAYQFGYHLTDEEAISQGLGIREGIILGYGKYDFIVPTTVYHEQMIERIIDGVRIKLERAPGETDDTILIWLEDDQVIFTGDNYYGLFPALYAIRGTQYRDLAIWIDSLDLILSYPSQVLLPGHTKPLMGKEKVQEVVGNFKRMIEYILFETFDCMNKGLTLDETVQTVKLPQELSSLPYLGEYYGMVEWAVKSVFVGYVGWFDGDAVNLLPVSQREYNKELLELIGEEKLFNKIRDCMNHEQYQLALQLLELVDHKELKKECLLKRAKQVTSANARHYYLESAKHI